MNSLKVFINKQHYYIAWAIGVAALFWKYFYIFHFTSFRDSLKDDMGAYWYDSLQWAAGNHTFWGQWGGFAPFYKYYFLAPFFQLLSNMGCFHYALPLTILSNILLYSISSCVFYLMVNKLSLNKMAALAALMFYSFSYLATYVNALVLPDSLAVALTVISTGIMILATSGIFVFMAALFLGIAIAAKPFLVVFSPVFIWYIFSEKFCPGRVWKVMVFILALVVVPMMTITENYRVSHGKLKSLAAIGGINFLQGWGKVGRVRTIAVGQNDARWSPGAVDERSWEPVTVKEPWYHQGYFYHLGLESIAQNPAVLFEKFFWFKKFFWGVLGPCLRKPPGGYSLIMPMVSRISYMMFLSLGILFIFTKTDIDSKSIFFLFFLLASFFTAIYVMGLPERRYFLSIEFIVIALFFMMLKKLMTLYRIYKKEVMIYVLVVFSFFFCIPAAWEQLGKLF